MSRLRKFCVRSLRAMLAIGSLAFAGCIAPEESDIAGTWRGDDRSTLVLTPEGRLEATGFDWSKVADRKTIRELGLPSDCTGEWRLVPAISGGGEQAVELTVHGQETGTVFFHIAISGRGLWRAKRPYDLYLHIRSGDPNDGNYCVYRRIRLPQP